jgi:hypothetical protein
MSDNNETNRLAENKIKQEIDGLDKLVNLIEKKAVTQDSLLKIIDEGNDEFKNEFGRNMSYSEMRARYG